MIRGGVMDSWYVVLSETLQLGGKLIKAVQYLRGTARTGYLVDTLGLLGDNLIRTGAQKTTYGWQRLRKLACRLKVLTDTRTDSVLERFSTPLCRNAAANRAAGCGQPVVPSDVLSFLGGRDGGYCPSNLCNRRASVFGVEEVKMVEVTWNWPCRDWMREHGERCRQDATLGVTRDAAPLALPFTGVARRLSHWQRRPGKLLA